MIPALLEHVSVYVVVVVSAGVLVPILEVPVYPPGETAHDVAPTDVHLSVGKSLNAMFEGLGEPLTRRETVGFSGVIGGDVVVLPVTVMKSGTVVWRTLPETAVTV